VALSTCLRTDYNDHVLAAQFLFHTRWYLLPFAPVAVWLVSLHLRARWRWPQPLLWGATAAICLAVLACRLTASPCGWWQVIHAQGVAFEPDEWLALAYLREHTPADAIVMTDHYLQYNFAISGLTGRAAYYVAYAGDPAVNCNQGDDRAGTISRLWSCTDDATFRGVLLPTPVNYLIEFADHPLCVRPPDCLTPVWAGPAGQVRIWSVKRPSSGNRGSQ
jgi:hypothetical protein